MPPKKRGRAKAPARAKRQAKKRPAKQAAKKPAKKAPKEDDVRRNRCFLITSKDSVKIQLADASGAAGSKAQTMGLLETPLVPRRRRTKGRSVRYFERHITVTSLHRIN